MNHLDEEEMAHRDGVAQGHHESRQEMLGKLRFDYSEAVSHYRKVEEYRKSFYAAQIKYLEDLVKGFFGEEEEKNLKMDYWR